MITITKESHTSLLANYQRVRTQSENLCAPLQKEDYVAQPVVFVSPPKWHLGHTTWFFETFLLQEYLPNYQLFHPRYAYVFNSYYEGAGERVNRSDRGNLTRPTVDNVYAYRAYVDQQVEKLLQEIEITEEIAYIVEIGLHHEQQHQELLCYDIQYILGHNPLFPTYQEGAEVETHRPLGEIAWLEMPEGVYEIGHDGQEFHFDNEAGRHRVFLEPYRIMDRLITNGEFLEFVESGAYQQYQHWLEEGWAWVKANQVDSPMYWFQVNGQWQQFSLQGMHALDLNAPVSHISYYEAQAFAKWKGLRLPTEFEWEAACLQYAPEIPEEANFVDSAHYRPVARSAKQYQFFGDCWEWTQSAYLPYPRYEAPAGTLGEYNGKFMVNQMVLKGGSCATPRDHIRPTYRNFFHAEMRWHYTGLRLAQTLDR
ncbi:MAG: ergothioneine biosynthesis protein EgtB [Bacteroidota bacterium]